MATSGLALVGVANQDGEARPMTNSRSRRPDPGSTLTLLLPPRSRFAGQTLPSGLAGALARADAAVGEPGSRAQLQRHAELLPRHWPMAAITRQLDAGDAELGRWLRADPAHVRADINAVRMLACGNLGLTRDETEALLMPLRPLFGDAGFPISAPVPERWYLHLPRESKLPEFVEPETVLGDDLYEHLPAGDLGRRWRALLNEAQVILHNHPVNAERIARGALPVNSVWFWGAGVLPDAVHMTADAVFSSAVDLAGLAALAGLRLAPPPANLAALETATQGQIGRVLIDLRPCRDPAGLARDWLLPALAGLAKKRIVELRLDFADGSRLCLTRGQRWRLWRRVAAVWHT